ncbi:MAG: TRAP transporter substrate-binding protein [Planctomycetota bacterium]
MNPVSHWLMILTLSALCFGGPTGCSPASSSESESAAVRDRTLRLVSLQNTTTPIFGESIVWLSESVEAMSNGGLKLKVFDPDKLVGATGVLDAVASGKVDAGYSSSGFWMGKMPAAPLFSAVPFGPDPVEYLSWFYHGNGLALYQEMYDRAGFDVKVLVCAITPPETSGWFTQKIESPEDLSGLKMRFFGLGGEVMAKFGVAVRLLPPAEIYPALEKGVIDATEFAMPSADESFGFYKIAKYNYFPGWHQQATTYELLINREVWDSLAPSQQAMIENAARANIVKSIAVGEGSQGAAMLRNEERGVSQETWSPAMLEAYRQAWAQVVAERSEQDAFFKKVWDDLSAFRAEYGRWSSKAHLD